MATRSTGATGTRTPAQVFALVFGVVYLLIGLVGFAVTGFDGFASETYDEKLLLFPVNPLHNLVHIAIGGLWLYGAKDHATSKTVNLVIGVAYLGVFLLGILGVLNFLAIEDAGSADNYLHLGTGLLAVYFGTAGATAPASSRTA